MVNSFSSFATFGDPSRLGSVWIDLRSVCREQSIRLVRLLRFTLCWKNALGPFYFFRLSASHTTFPTLKRAKSYNFQRESVEMKHPHCPPFLKRILSNLDIVVALSFRFFFLLGLSAMAFTAKTFFWYLDAA